MSDLKYYFSIFLRRLPWFLVVSTILSAISVTVAFTLPPAYVSQMRLIVESPQIPEELAPSTVRTPPVEQLEVLQQKLLTRSNLLDIARRLNVLPNTDKMNPDQIVQAMRARTSFEMPRGRNPVPLMTISFEAPTPRNAAEVLNEYLTLIQQEDVEFRRGRAGETLEFFSQEIERLSNELDDQSARILEFKEANTNDLPDSLDFRLSQQALLQERYNGLDREIASLQNQRTRLIELFEQTGRVADPDEDKRSLTPDQQRLADLQRQLDEALAIYSPENPRVTLLQARIKQLQATIATTASANEVETPENAIGAQTPSMLDFQLAEIDSRLETLSSEKTEVDARLKRLTESIERTPGVAITLQEMERKYSTIQTQFDQAEDRLSKARTGERIEARSRGQRISVIEQPAVPSQPTKPNRMLIAAGGTLFGVVAGLALVVLLEFLNTTARRPEDLVNRFGITPFTTIPYVRTRGQRFRQRASKLFLILAILTGIPAAIYAVHVYYLPLDLLADQLMNKIGVRW
ncbi:GumC family protein [Marimonas arenosa]|uniref:Lipopolysaccharide biosynthesis protein n=1 Tax=Marimonas arenosa TaxID=1795305 RepID=A0AAE4B5U4_9RHOB|nr:lipopolysaccharide biosynthesis protein [Marimonas arenosa]MDQ2089661.1 lipopolysaccharide biosynthesis protein [Marimonas arenosa]